MARAATCPDEWADEFFQNWRGVIAVRRLPLSVRSVGAPSRGMFGTALKEELPALTAHLYHCMLSVAETY